MSKTVNAARKLLLLLVLVGLGVTLMPTAPVHARAAAEPGAPPVSAELRSRRLERVWARQQRIHERLSVMFDHAQQRIGTAQDRIDQAESNGRDVAALQAALDAFSAALQEGRPVYESTKGILAAHKGFDPNGKVTDAAMAAETIEAMAGKLQEIRRIMLDPGKALREAIRAFRQSNRPN
ncbi:MAG: hypothetical protein V1755_09620 [Chloroflexota bacterium]